ncbi:hypothetical protein NKH69_34505, partial [Mesorhizobium sp. M0976]
MLAKLAAFGGHSMHIAKGTLMCSLLLGGTIAAELPAHAEDINWRQFEGASIVWAYDIHPYADAVAAQLPEFEKLTGIKVTPELYPDDSYWNKLTIQLTTKSPARDVVGIGIEPAWDFGFCRKTWKWGCERPFRPVRQAARISNCSAIDRLG